MGCKGAVFSVWKVRRKIFAQPSFEFPWKVRGFFTKHKLKRKKGYDDCDEIILKYDKNNERNITMKESVYTSYDELPLFLNAETVAKLLGISISSSYELMHEKGFPSLRIGSRLIVPKEKFRQWVGEKTGGTI